jgi:prepilin-type N-terminal cleavage/methylation domain-containing protein
MKARRDSGFSLTELVVAMAVAMILMAVAMPYFLRAYHFYQLSNAATQMADILRLTRYEAIRLNRTVNCVVQPDANDATMTDALMTDAKGIPLTGLASRMALFGSSGNLVGSVTGAGALPAAAALGATTPTVVPPTGGTVPFDARGALTSGKITVFYLKAPGSPESGSRAVLLMPAGSIQIWSGDSAGNWQQMR